MASSSTTKHYDGSSDVEAFITQVELKAAIKGYDGEKKAQYLASQLAEGHALNIYLKLSDDDKKDCDNIETALREEFDAAHRNREVAVEKLLQRKTEKGESPSVFAYRLMELAKLAYSSLPDESQKAIAKDYFVAAQPREMQVALKSITEFGNKTIADLAKEVTRLQTASVPTTGTQIKKEEAGIYHVEQRQGSDRDTGLINEIAAKVLQKLSFTNVEIDESGKESVNFMQYSQGGCGSRSYRRGRPFASNRGRKNYAGNIDSTREGSKRGTFNCRNCRSPNYGYAKCPIRFCQACGQRGHDAWNRDCPNYE